MPRRKQRDDPFGGIGAACPSYGPSEGLRPPQDDIFKRAVLRKGCALLRMTSSNVRSFGKVTPSSGGHLESQGCSQQSDCTAGKVLITFVRLDSRTIRGRESGSCRSSFPVVEKTNSILRDETGNSGFRVDDRSMIDQK
jgi:hypothetical protein